MTRTKTYSLYPVKGCADCPGATLVSSKTAPHAKTVCVFTGGRLEVKRPLPVQPDHSPTWCPLRTGDVMVTAE